MLRVARNAFFSTLIAICAASAAVSFADSADGGTACEKAAKLARSACKGANASDLDLENGKCIQSTDKSEVRRCKADALDAFRESNAECRDQQAARKDLCAALHEDVYDPRLDPAHFVAAIDNPFSPFPVGARWVYENDGAAGLERIEVEVTDQTRMILGIPARVVRDRGFLDGELVEDTQDWLAQDMDGNVWYLGELSYTVENGNVVSLEGSWEAGVDGAKPGLWMKGSPAVGDVYRQELKLGEAEDFGEVLSLAESITVPAGAFTACLKTRDRSALEPDADENKVFAPGVGLVAEIDPVSGEVTRLVELELP